MKIANKKIINEEKYYVLISFFILLMIRLIALPINSAEYTDGILLITQFSQPNDLYPPFYSLLAYVFGGFGRWLEFGGKIVSVIFSSLLVFPLFYLAKNVAGERVARYSSLIYVAAPIPLRWGVRVMSDATFSFLFISSVYFMFQYFKEYKNSSSELKEKKSKAEQNIIIGIIISVLATLTHYRGIILLPISIFAVLLVLMIEKKIPLKIILAHFVWLAIPLWMRLRGFQHFSQIEERMGLSPLETFLNYLNNFESFILLLPYFLTYPIAFFVIYGIFKGKIFENDKKIFSLITFFLILFLLVLQSVFSSFQSRYLLPILPLLFIFCAIGFAECEDYFKQRKNIFKIIFCISFMWSFLFAILVCGLQREIFGDIKSAGKYLMKLEISKEQKIFSNEFYKPNITGTKLAFWSGKKINMVEDFRTIPPNSILVIHSAYGGMNGYRQLLRYLPEIYEIKLLKRFESSIVPLLPDVMEEPHTHQNPAAWVFRYRPQYFETTIFEVKDRKTQPRNFFP